MVVGCLGGGFGIEGQTKQCSPPSILKVDVQRIVDAFRIPQLDTGGTSIPVPIIQVNLN